MASREKREKRERTKTIILRLLRGVQTGTSRFGDGGDITTMEIEEVVSYALYGRPGGTDLQVYPLLKVMENHNWVISHADHRHGSAAWQITAAGASELVNRSKDERAA
jgi:hypothetical protein